MRVPEPRGVFAASIAFALCLGGASGGLAQSTVPNHKHYEESPQAAQPGPSGEMAPRLLNLGSHTFPVSTKSKKAQSFMNQGLNLTYGFNHAEAGRAYREAARLDPSCAMAYWGQALVLGPNINAPMDANNEPQALALAQKAVSLKGKASPREQALIDALAERYSGKTEDRAARDKAYAAAMKKVVARFPGDLDIATLYVESVMDLRPWGYWMPDNTPYAGTEEIVALTESVIAPEPQAPRGPPPLHPPHGAHHQARSGGGGGRRAPAAGPRSRAPRPHGLPHLSAGGTLRGLRQVQPGRGALRRGLHHPVPGPGLLSHGLLPAQRPLHLVRGHHGRPWPARGGLGPQGGGARSRTRPSRSCRSWPASGSCPTSPSPASGAGTRYWRSPRRRPATSTWRASGTTPAAWPSWPRAGPAKRNGSSGRCGVLPPTRASSFRSSRPTGGPRSSPSPPRCSRASWRRRARTGTPRSATSSARCAWKTASSTPSRPSGTTRRATPWAPCCSQAGRAREAETVYWEDLKQNRENGWALFGLARALEAQGTDRAGGPRPRALREGLGPRRREARRLAHPGTGRGRRRLTLRRRIKKAERSSGVAP